MAEMFEIKVDTSQLDRIRRLGDAAKDGRKPLKDFFLWYKARLTVMFARCGKGTTGGSDRGATWKGFANQYTRKTDGVTVPAWGGVEKLYGKGNVKGRKRTKGRVTAGSRLMRDTDAMFGRSLARPSILTQTQMRVFGTPEYAKYQHAIRPWLFFYESEDQPAFAGLVDAFLTSKERELGLT